MRIICKVCYAKDYHIFPKKNNSVFVILTNNIENFEQPAPDMHYQSHSIASYIRLAYMLPDCLPLVGIYVHVAWSCKTIMH